ncbi:MAG: FAD-linked oxidase C-terminal domain-containing protein [Desulfobacterales bacterium]
MKPDKLHRNLKRIVGKPHVSVRPTDRELYSYDASQVRGIPDIVAFPGNTGEVSRVVRLAHDTGVPFVPRGFGTNLSGGTILTDGGLVIGLTRLNRILRICPTGRWAVVQPGVTNLELQNALSPEGFFFAPDPASQKVATLGGNTAENSGGPHCLKYGVTTNHILGMTVVFADGEVVRIGGASLDPPGYDLRGLLVGSEGTLGIVTEITVRILPKPESLITLLAIYDAVADAARSVSDITAAGITPATLEMMDTPIIEAVEDSYACGYPRDAAAVLIIEVEGPRVGLDDQAQRIHDICMDNGCREVRKAEDDDQRQRLWEGRRGAFGAVARISPNYIVNDCTVPRTRLPDALEKVAEIAEENGFRHGNVFHAGDGNLHPLIFFDAREGDQADRAKKAGRQIMAACVALGGTITGEHGVGLEKKAAMELVFTEADLDTQRVIKRTFDPKNLLNPGKMFPEPSPERPMGSAELRAGAPEQEIIDAVRNAIKSGLHLSPVGLGNHSDRGNLLRETVTPLTSGSVAPIIQIDSANQVVTVGAAMPLTTLQSHLAQHDQWLPIRPPVSHDSDYSVGGMIALGASGPERGYYGAPRDLLLGLRYVDGQGQFISTGGKVVKNVAGYDMTRLIAGSLGTLGFITEATLRIAARPEQCTAITGTGSLAMCTAAASRLIESVWEPAFVVAVAGISEDSDVAGLDWRLYAGFEGFAETVAYQGEQASALLKEQGFRSPDQTDYDVHKGILDSIYDRYDESPFTVRVDTPLDRVGDVAKEMMPRIAKGMVSIDFLSGRMVSRWDDLTDKDWAMICDLAHTYTANVTLEKAPTSFKEKWDVFGRPRSDWQIMHRIKSALDPHGVFSPGRLPGRNK